MLEAVEYISDYWRRCAADGHKLILNHTYYSSCKCGMRTDLQGELG